MFNSNLGICFNFPALNEAAILKLSIKKLTSFEASFILFEI